MSLRIKHRSQCAYCQQWFGPGEAFLQRKQGSWACQCDHCYNKRKVNKKTVAYFERLTRQIEKTIGSPGVGGFEEGGI